MTRDSRYWMRLLFKENNITNFNKPMMRLKKAEPKKQPASIWNGYIEYTIGFLGKGKKC